MVAFFLIAVKFRPELCFLENVKCCTAFSPTPLPRIERRHGTVPYVVRLRGRVILIREFSYLRHGRSPGKEGSRVRILDKLPAKLFFQSVSEGA